MSIQVPETPALDPCRPRGSAAPDEPEATSVGGDLGRTSVYVHRPWLGDRLDQVARAGAVAVLVGPAGSGKSALAAHWTADQGGPVRFLDTCRTERDVELLARRCAASEAGVVVVGDVDIAASSPVARRLAEVVAGRSTGTAVVLCGRRTWLAQLADERTGGVVIDGEALALTANEIRVLLGRVGVSGVSPQLVEGLRERTWGWAIVVHLAALSMRASVDAGEAPRLPNGNDRHLRSFLRGEVLRDEVPRVRRFLRRCAALDSVPTSLCARICDPAADAILADLRARSLPVVRSAADGSQLIIHPLLRDVLLGELRDVDPASEDRILMSAASWLRHHGSAEAAAQILARTQRWDELIELIDEQGRRVAGGGRHDDVLRWIDAIPTAAGRGSPAIALRRAALLTMAGHTGRAEASLHALTGSTVTAGERATSHTIRAAWAFFDAPPASAIRSADQALELLKGPGAGHLVVPNVLGVGTREDLRFIARSARARGMWLLDHVEAAHAAFAELAHETGREPFRLTAVGGLALLHAWRGDAARARHEAQATLAGARAVAAAHHLSTLDAWLALAHIHRERGDLAVAARDLHAAEAVLQRVWSPAGDAIRTVEAAQLLLASGRAREALAAVEAHWAGPGRAPLPIVDDRLLAVQARAYLALGAVERAAELVSAAPNPLSMTKVAAIQVALASGELPDAEERLADLEVAVDSGPTGRILVDLLGATIDLARGARGAAVERAGLAMDVALATGNLRSVVDLGAPTTQLLRVLERHDPNDGRARLLALAAQAGTPLSERELEIVRFLPTPLRSAQIAAALFISLNTLKTHLASIYRKLGVSDRAGATQRAMELGLA